jgi:hypothetical protein
MDMVTVKMRFVDTVVVCRVCQMLNVFATEAVRITAIF